MPRQTRLDQQLRRLILERVAGGIHPRRAAQMLGVSGGTFDKWMEKGATEPTPDGPDPKLEAMPLDTLRALGAEFGVPLPKNANAAQMAKPLADAGVHAWDSYRSFRLEIEEADAQAEGRCAVAVQAASTTNPTAMLSFMERRWRQRWARQDQLALTGADGGPVSVTIEESIAASVAAYLQGVDDAPATSDVES